MKLRPTVIEALWTSAKNYANMRQAEGTLHSWRRNWAPAEDSIYEIHCAVGCCPDEGPLMDTLRDEWDSAYERYAKAILA